MNVVFVNPPIRLPLAFAHYPMFSSLGMLANAAWLRERGHAVRIIDAFTLSPRLNIRADGGSFRHIGAEVDQVADAARAAAQQSGEGTAVIIGVTMFSDMNRMGENLVAPTAAGVRDLLPDASIGLADLHICGMNYFPYDARRVIAGIPAVDWILLGEAEPTLPDLLGRIDAAVPVVGVPRLVHRTVKGEPVVEASFPEPLEDLDQLPPPAFDLLDMENYFSCQADAIRNDLVHEFHAVERHLPLMTSRGCPFRCSFCTNQVLDLPWRAHSVDYIRAAVTDLRERYRVERFLFLDDNINVDRSRFRALVTMLAERGTPWDAVNGYRADGLDRDAVRAIKAAGNAKITISAESGDADQLKQLRKGLKLSAVVRVAKLCEAERVPLQVHYILGVPGETTAQINTTLEFATALLEEHGAWPLLQHAIPFPGTKLFEDCVAQGFFVKAPFEIPGDILEEHGIIRTPEFSPEEIDRLKKNAQHLHATIQALAFVDLGCRCTAPSLACECPDDGEPLSRERVGDRLDRARFVGGRELYIGGGEPTAHPALREIVADARNRGFARIVLIDAAQALADAAAILTAVDHVVAWLYGPSAPAYDAVAGSTGGFIAAIEGLQLVRRSGATFDVNVPVCRANLEALPDTVRLAQSLGAQAVHLRYPGPRTRAFAAGEVPAWPQAEPWLLRALGHRRSGSVTLQGVPLCLMRKPRGALRPLPHWRLRPSRRDRAKHPVCRSCVGYIVCGGFYRPDHEPTYRMLGAAGLSADADAPRDEGAAARGLS